MRDNGDHPKTALITGASSGIGWELAKLFAADGYRLILVARNEGKLLELSEILKEAHGTEAIVVTCDLSDPEAPECIHDLMTQEKIRIDVLVNNAGVGAFGAFHELDDKAQADLIQINVTTLTRLTRLFLPDMVLRKSGKILNVASTAAFQSGPYAAVYYASKAFVLAFSEALSVELEGSGVTVTAFCPGLIRTDFHRRAGISQQGTQGKLMMSAEAAARIGYKGMQENKRLVIPGWHNRILVQLQRIFPRIVTARAVAKLQKQRL